MNEIAHKLEEKWLKEEMRLEESKSRFVANNSLDQCENMKTYRFLLAEAWRLKKCRLELQEAFGLMMAT